MSLHRLLRRRNLSLIKCRPITELKKNILKFHSSNRRKLFLSPIWNWKSIIPSQLNNCVYSESMMKNRICSFRSTLVFIWYLSINAIHLFLQCKWCRERNHYRHRFLHRWFSFQFDKKSSMDVASVHWRAAFFSDRKTSFSRCVRRWKNVTSRPTESMRDELLVLIERSIASSAGAFCVYCSTPQPSTYTLWLKVCKKREKRKGEHMCCFTGCRLMSFFLFLHAASQWRTNVKKRKEREKKVRSWCITFLYDGLKNLVEYNNSYLLAVNKDVKSLFHFRYLSSQILWRYERIFHRAMKRTINAIVGRSDQHLSSALDSLPDLHVRFAPRNEHEYTLVTDHEQSKGKRVIRRKSNLSPDFDRQASTTHGNIDQFEVWWAFDCSASCKRNEWISFSRQLGMEIWNPYKFSFRSTKTIVKFSSIGWTQKRN